jgi:hypothetical protein
MSCVSGDFLFYEEFRQRSARDKLATVEKKIEEQASDLPHDFCDDESLEAFVQNRDHLSSDVREAINSFIIRFTSVEIRAKLFRARIELQNEVFMAYD